MLTYVINKKQPQVFWMIRQIKDILENKRVIKKEHNINKNKFSFYNNILFFTKTLINKYIESNEILLDNYLLFLLFFVEKNKSLINDDHLKRLKTLQLGSKKEFLSLDSTVWKNVEFYNILNLYNLDATDIRENNISEITNKINIVATNEFDFCILDVGGGKGDLSICLSLAFKNVLIIILDININSLFSCFIKMYCNRIKNVLIINESILDFNFEKYKIDLIVGLHCCGGLTDFLLKKCVELKISFLICSCCYTKYRDMRNCLFDFQDEALIDKLHQYIYGKENCEHNWNRKNKDKREDTISVKTGVITHSTHLQKYSGYDKYEKKVMRRTIPTLNAFINLLAKLCESDNKDISFKCMHFYNTLRFLILEKKVHQLTNVEQNVDDFQFSLHSFPISFSPKNLVLKGSFK